MYTSIQYTYITYYNLKPEDNLGSGFLTRIMVLREFVLIYAC